MTAKSLPNASVRNALRVVRQNTKMTVVTCILQLLGIPLALGAALCETIADSRRGDDLIGMFRAVNSGFYTGIGVFLLGVAVFMGLFAAIHSYTELHSKSKVDMLYALPLTGRQRFFSNYLGGCLIYVVPYVICVIIGWAELLGLGTLINFDYEYVSSNSYGEFLAESGKIYALASCGLLALMLFYYTLSVLVTVCCGTLFESIYTNFLLNGLIPGTVAVVLLVLGDHLPFDFEYTWQIIGYMSPIGGLIYMIYLIEDLGSGSFASSSYGYAAAAETTTHEMLPNYFRWIITILVITALLLVAAWQLYIRRKAEKVGQPFVYIGAYYVMLTLGIVAILCLLDANVVGPAILFSAIVYFVMEVIRKRGFKKFWLSAITYIATVAVSVGLFMLIVHTGAFGRANYVPAPAVVTSVQLEFDAPGTYGGDYRLEYTNKDVIKDVTAFHKQLLAGCDDRFRSDSSGITAEINQTLNDKRMLQLEYEGGYDSYNAFQMPHYELHHVYSAYAGEINYWGDYDETMTRQDDVTKWPEDLVGDYANTSYVEITYYTITGSAVNRTYRITRDELYELLRAVQGTELYSRASADYLQYILFSDYAEYDSDSGKRLYPERIRMDLYSTSSARQTVTVFNVEQTVDRLVQAYENDLNRMTADEFRTAEIFGMLGNHSAPIYENCTETVAILKELGFREFTMPEKMDFADTENIEDYASDASWYSDGSYLTVRLYKPGTWQTASLQYPYSTIDTAYVVNDKEGEIPACEDMYLCGSKESMRKNYPELYALLSAARRNYVTDEECWLVVVDGDTYVLPAADSALAEAVAANGDGWYLKEYTRRLNEQEAKAAAQDSTGGVIFDWNDLTEEEQEYYRSGGAISEG